MLLEIMARRSTDSVAGKVEGAWPGMHKYISGCGVHGGAWGVIVVAGLVVA